MRSLIGALITFIMEMMDNGYRSLLIWLLYPNLIAFLPVGLPQHVPFMGVFMLVLMIRIMFIDFTDVVSLEVIQVEEEKQE